MNSVRQGARRAVVSLPDLLVLGLLALTLPVAVAVTVGVFRPWVVLTAAVAAGVALWRLRPAPLSGDRAAVPAALALGAVLVWAVVQVRLGGESIVVDRDPAVYALTGWWLLDHPSVAVPMTEAAEAARGVDAARTVALGFGRSADPLLPEANHTVPGLVAVVGWVAGPRGVLAGNVALASVALLALYGAARRLVGVWWGLLPAAVLALSMPMVAFSRSTYSEPLALAMVSGVVLVLAGTLGGGRPWADARPFVLAGLFAGAVALARVDGGLVLLGTLLVVGVAAVLVPVPARRGLVLLAALAVPGVALFGLGLLDLALNSGYYLGRSREQAGVVAITVGLVAAAGVSAGLVAAGPRLAPWVRTHRAGLATSAVVLAGLVAVALLSRPWWYVARGFEGSPGFQRDIERYQVAEGLLPDGARSYDELTLTWVSWYLGWLTVLLGLAGIALMVDRLLRRGQVVLLAALLPLGVPALLYLVYPTITPDQVWAMRRLLVAALPMLLLGTTAVLAWLAGTGRIGRVVAAGVVALVLTWPTTAFSGLYGVRERAGQVEEAQAACAQIDDGRAVVAGSRPGFDYLATVRIVCDAQVVQVQPVTREALARLVEQWGGEPLTLLTFSPDEVPWTQDPDQPVHVARIASWERSLLGPPQRAPVQERSLWAGTVQPDGRVEPR